MDNPVQNGFQQDHSKLGEFFQRHESLIIALGVGVLGLVVYHQYANGVTSLNTQPPAQIGPYTGGASTTTNASNPTQDQINLLTAQQSLDYTTKKQAIDLQTASDAEQLKASQNQFDWLFGPIQTVKPTQGYATPGPPTQNIPVLPNRTVNVGSSYIPR